MAEKYTATFPVRITNKMARDLRAAAMREYMTVSQLIRKLLREALEKK